MQAPGTPSVDQLLVLLTVVEEGSFTRAAKRLGRANSAVSYAIDTLEAQLGVSLFDRGTTRKPKLTHVGEAIVSEARAVAHSVETLRARVRGLLEGLEAEVSLVVDSFYPTDQLVKVLDDFHEKFPTVPLRLSVQPLEGVERVVRNGDAWIGVRRHHPHEQHRFAAVADRGRSDHSGCCSEPSPCFGRRHVPLACPRSRPACSIGSACRRRTRPWCCQPDELAGWRPDVEAQASGRWDRVGWNARTDGACGHRSRTARAIGPSRLARRTIRDAGGAQDRNAAGAGGPVADRTPRAFAAKRSKDLIAASR